MLPSDVGIAGLLLLTFRTLQAGSYASQSLTAPQLIVARGAKVDACEAANHGLLDRVRELIDEDPARVNARGGWGTPLHPRCLSAGRLPSSTTTCAPLRSTVS